MFFVVVESGELLQVFGLEHRVAIQAAHVIHPIPPHQELRALMFTARHKKQTNNPILMKVELMSRPTEEAGLIWRAGDGRFEATASG